MTHRPMTKAGPRHLPYGFYVDQDGNQILFNRRYQPIVGRTPGGWVYGVNPDTWIKCKEQRYFYDDGSLNPQDSIANRQRLLRVVHDFFDGKPISKYAEQHEGIFPA